MNKTRAGLMVLGIVVLGFGSSAQASGFGFGPSLAIDQLPLAGQLEFDLNNHWSLTTGLSLLAFGNVGATYFWKNSDGGFYTSARAGVNLATPAFSLYAHQGYRFAFDSGASLDLEAGFGAFNLDVTTYAFNQDPITRNETLLLPSLGLRLNFKF